MPSKEYPNRVSLFEQVFASGVAPYAEKTGMDLFRLVTGVQETDIKPYFATDKPYRATYHGASGLFTVDQRDVTAAEVLGSLGFETAPHPSFVIRYGFSGQAVFLDRVQQPAFHEQFLQATGQQKHEFSQDCRYYLESQGLITDSQALSWTSASGQKLGEPAHTFMILPPFSGALSFRDYDQVA